MIKKLFLPVLLFLFTAPAISAQSSPDWNTIVVQLNLPIQVDYEKDISMNGENTFSKKEQKTSYFNLFIKGSEMDWNGLKFNLVDVNDPAFSFTEVKAVEGELNQARDMIKWIKVEWSFYNFGGSREFNFTEENKQGTAYFENIPLKYAYNHSFYWSPTTSELKQVYYRNSTYSTGHGNRKEFVCETYASDDLASSTAQLVRVEFSKKDGVKKNESPATDVKVVTMEKNTFITAYSALIISELKKQDKVRVFDGTADMVKHIVAEKELAESGLTDPNASIDPDKVAAALEKEHAIELLIRHPEGFVAPATRPEDVWAYATYKVPFQVEIKVKGKTHTMFVKGYSSDKMVVHNALKMSGR